MRTYNTNTCEIVGCYNPASCNMSGVRVCERCADGFTSLGIGAVLFADGWHGVRGATYTQYQVATHPGLRSWTKP